MSRPFILLLLSLLHLSTTFNLTSIPAIPTCAAPAPHHLLSSLLLRSLSPRKARQLARARHDLSHLSTVLNCQRHLLSLRVRAREIRKCVYNGLPYRKYTQLRAVCLQRSEQLEALRAQKRACNARTNRDRCFIRMVEPMRKVRKEIIVACQQIGWDGKRKQCGKLKDVKQSIADKEAEGCDTDLTMEEVGLQVDKLKKRVAWLEKMANPQASNVPREK